MRKVTPHSSILNPLFRVLVWGYLETPWFVIYDNWRQRHPLPKFKLHDHINEYPRSEVTARHSTTASKWIINLVLIFKDGFSCITGRMTRTGGGCWVKYNRLIWIWTLFSDALYLPWFHFLFIFNFLFFFTSPFPN